MSTAAQASEELIRAVNNKNALAKQLTNSRVTCDQKKSLIRHSTLTLQELEPIPDDAVSYRAVGRMFLKHGLSDIRAEIQTIIDTEQTEVDKLEKVVVTLTAKLEEADKDLQELLASTGAVAQ
mgnify:CR=1 FL=1